MKKVLITMLMAMLAVMMLTACGSNKSGEEVEPVKDEPPVTVETEDPSSEPSEDSMFEVGKEYILKDDLRVRKGPSADSEWMMKSELSDEDKGKALDFDEAVLSKGTIVKCLETDGNWIRMSSGWICGYVDGRLTLLDTEFEEMAESSKAKFYEKVGIDQNSSKKLSGKYSVSAEGSMDSVEFFEDGECVVHFSTPMTPMTDEEGYTDGYYAVSGNKVYMNYGGRIDAEAYELSGQTLTKTSETIDLMAN